MQTESNKIGPYVLHEVLGEGGMGTVYRAVQTEPVQREVALKIIKAGMDTQEVVARFRSERQALAVMDHTSIAKVLDAGATDAGRPYFVMELVRGVALDDYCDTHKLTTRERLELFVRVCDAVHHAHQKGVIHRDLKPSNIMVSVEAERPLPKVIDFGIAKAVGVSASADGSVTTVGQMLGTPAYMSPEQAEGSGLDVDTRTDVYSLGVILYQLLAGALPFDRSTFQKPDLVVQYLIREKELPTPSVRLADLPDTQKTVASNRRTDVRTLRRALRGDLDWIVMRAIEKDRTRRYAATSELAADLQRYLDGEPVLARPPSISYRLGKLARRHRGALAASVALAISLVGGAAVSTVGFVRAERSASAASAALSRAEAVNDFLDRMLSAADPVSGGGAATTVEAVLNAASEEVDGGSLADEPLVEAAVRTSIGNSYMGLGLYEPAKAHLTRARTLFDEAPDASATDRVRILQALGQLERREDDLAASEAYYGEALSLAQSAGLSTDGAAGERLANDLRNDLGLVLWDMDRLEEAGVILEALAASERQLLDPDDVDLAATLNNLALVKRDQGDIQGALDLFEETKDVLAAAFGPSHIYIAAVLESIGILRERQGDLARADSLLLLSLEMRRELLGERHPDYINGLNSIGLLNVNMAEYADADAYLGEALSLATEVHGERHTRTALILNSIGLLNLRRERPAAAVDAFRRAVSIREEQLGARHGATLNANANLASALLQTGRPEDAEALVRRVVASQDSAGVTDPYFLGSARRTLGKALTALGRFPEAEGELTKAYGLLEPAVGGENEQTRSVVDALVELYEAWGRPEQAAEWRERGRGGAG